MTLGLDRNCQDTLADLLIKITNLNTIFKTATPHHKI